MDGLTIIFSPVRGEGGLVLDRQGDLLIANGVAHDLAALAAEETDAPGAGPVLSVKATEDGYEAVVALPHGAEASEAVRFPQPVVVEADGEIAVPG